MTVENSFHFSFKVGDIFSSLGLISSTCTVKKECSAFYSSNFLEIAKIPKEKAMAPHSSTLAWKIPWTEEPGRLQSMGSLRVRCD